MHNGGKNQPLNLKLACGLPGQPYFWVAQDEIAKTRAAKSNDAKILFFIIRIFCAVITIRDRNYFANIKQEYRFYGF
jgi:hypothetical protein